MIDDQANAAAWLITPNCALSGQVPLGQLDTDPGAKMVKDILSRIAYGACS